MKKAIVDRLRQPEYTGDNRCGACTAVNVLIAGAIGALVARKSKLAGAVAVGASLVLISLRGYLVPGTPTLTKRYLPPEVLGWFGKESEPEIHGGLGAVDASPAGASTEPPAGADTESPAVGSASTADEGRELAFEGSQAEDGDDGADTAGNEQASIPSAEAYFLERGVVEPCEDVDDLCLTDEFETAWTDEIDRIDADTVDATDAMSAFGFDDLVDDPADDDEFEIERHDDARVLLRDGRLIGKWPSQAALVADVTAARILEERDDDWDAYRFEARGQLLNGLRLFLETCPTTGGEVVMGEETVESCCRSHDVVAVTCEETGERLFEHPVPEPES
ncbi:hypothetical protein [Natrarchaeobius chitinivorans]|uniref:Uncharacterized protein n=1 Tax=Natrarchaeobius chitinivorans TaxID=1679083 RepID=A0A3N6LU37_NATCH|nr:hypothetical protein [Natrarchaeobius chitinivorans]RQG91044.1 hypothetical protein EA473_19045 [Natrarchaeobius chitinivorans]